MLTYEQLEKISEILNWTVPEVQASIETLNYGFMKPCVESFYSSDEGAGISEPGIYWRMSAPGYMDCTEWSGPLETEEEAVAEMLQMYAD